MKHQTMCSVSLLIIAVLLWGCAGSSAPQLTPQRNPDRDALYNRAKELWDAVLANERGKTVDFLLPEAREQFAQYQAMGGTSFNTISYNIDAVEIEADGIHGIVVVTNTFIAPPIPYPRTVPGQITNWVKVDGIWYHDYRPAPMMISGSRNAPGQ